MEMNTMGKKDEQKSLPGADTRDELLNKARDYQEKHKP
jgi:conjugal transfer mating pair stabilization protein TraG